jgi:hypothetical protein
MNGKRWTTALCLAVVTLLGAGRVWAADPERQQMDEVRTQMTAEGWTEIAEGVFERYRGETKVEHLGYGPAGLSWMVDDLTRRLEHLMSEYQSYPSEDLANIIDNLSLTIAKAKVELRNMPEGLSSATAALAGASCSNICYSATADAYYLTNVQGVAAVADAKFNSTCGYSGNTYAYAFARATLNGTTTTVTQEDPDTGTNINSHAVASVNGGSVTGIPCYSEANSYAQSSALGISYSTSDTNSLCPVQTQPLAVTINGPTSVSISGTACQTVTWTSTVSGGTTPYTYAWTIGGVASGSGISASKTYCGNNTTYTQTVSLSLRVTDAASTSITDTHSTNINYSTVSGGGGGGCSVVKMVDGKLIPGGEVCN